jgi:hypothetical protein
LDRTSRGQAFARPPLRRDALVIPVIVAIDHVTPEWLTAILARDGHLPVGQVQAVSVRHVHDEQVYTISYFLSVEYSPEAPPTAPTRLFLNTLPAAHSRQGTGVGQALL